MDKTLHRWISSLGLVAFPVVWLLDWPWFRALYQVKIIIEDSSYFVFHREVGLKAQKLYGCAFCWKFGNLVVVLHFYFVSFRQSAQWFSSTCSEPNLIWIVFHFVELRSEAAPLHKLTYLCQVHHSEYLCWPFQAQRSPCLLTIRNGGCLTLVWLVFHLILIYKQEFYWFTRLELSVHVFKLCCILSFDYNCFFQFDLIICVNMTKHLVRLNRFLLLLLDPLHQPSVPHV